jgi:hypothetical protein
MANYEAANEDGRLFRAWMDAMGLKAEKPQTPVFKTQEMYKRSTIEKIKMTIVGTRNQSNHEVLLKKR